MKNKIDDLTRNIRHIIDTEPTPNVRAFNNYFKKMQQCFSSDTPRDGLLESSDAVADMLFLMYKKSKDHKLRPQQHLCLDALQTVTDKSLALGAAKLDEFPVSFVYSMIAGSKHELAEIARYEELQQKMLADEKKALADKQLADKQFDALMAEEGASASSPKKKKGKSNTASAAASSTSPSVEHPDKNKSMKQEIFALTRSMQQFIDEKPTPPNVEAFDNYFRKIKQYYSAASKDGLMELRQDVAFTLAPLLTICEERKFIASQHLCLDAYKTVADRSLTLAESTLGNIRINDVYPLIDAKRARLAQMASPEAQQQKQVLHVVAGSSVVNKYTQEIINLTQEMNHFTKQQPKPTHAKAAHVKAAQVKAINVYFQKVEQYYSIDNIPPNDHLGLKDDITRTIASLITIGEENNLAALQHAGLNALQKVAVKSMNLGAVSLDKIFPITDTFSLVQAKRNKIAAIAAQKEQPKQKPSQGQNDALANQQYDALMAEEKAAAELHKDKKETSSKPASSLPKLSNKDTKPKPAQTPAVASSAPVASAKAQFIAPQELEQFTPVTAKKTRKAQHAEISAAPLPHASSFAQRVSVPIKPQSALQHHKPSLAAASPSPEQPSVSPYKRALLGQAPTPRLETKKAVSVTVPTPSAHADKPQAKPIAVPSVPVAQTKVTTPTPDIHPATPRAASPILADKPFVQMDVPQGEVTHPPFESAPSAPSRPKTPQEASPVLANKPSVQMDAPQGEVIHSPPESAASAPNRPVTPQTASPVLADSTSVQPVVSHAQQGYDASSLQPYPMMEQYPQQYPMQYSQQAYAQNSSGAQAYDAQGYFVPMQPQYPMMAAYQEQYPPQLPPAPPGYAYYPVQQQMPDPTPMLAWQISYQQQQMEQMQQRLSWQERELQRTQQQITRNTPHSFAANESGRKENRGQRQQGK